MLPIIKSSNNLQKYKEGLIISMYYYMKFLILFYSIFLCLLYSQEHYSVYGVVLDKDTNQPISNVNIYNDDNSIGTSTDSNGGFYIDINIEDSIFLFISHIGYEKQKILIDSNDSITKIFLEPLLLNSEKIIVTGNSSSKRLSDSPMPTQVIYSQELLSLGSSNLFESIQMILPNVTFQPDAHGANIKINGIDSEYIVILVDGEKLSGNTSGSVDFNRLNINDIDRIEVVKGASSVIYGSNAIGAVINIITKKHSKGFKPNLGFRFSNYNTKNFWSSLKFNIGNLFLNTDYISKKSDGYDTTPSTPKTWDLRKFDDMTLSQKLVYEFSDSSVLNIKYKYYDFEFFQPPENLIDRPHRKRYVANNYNINFKKNIFSNNIDLSLNYDQYRKYHILDDDYSQTNDDRRFPWTVDEYRSFKIIDVFSIKNQLLTLGYEFTKDSGKSYNVVAQGPENFNDNNNNGIWDAEEPYTDSDNDGHWDAGDEYYSTIPGFEDVCIESDNDGNCELEQEPFEDLDNSGTWNYAESYTDENLNGQYDVSIDRLLLGSEFGSEDYLYFNIHNFIFQNQIDFSENKIMIFGFRYIIHNRFGRKLMPSISYISKKIPFIHRANISMGYRTPSLKELYYNWDHYGMFEVIGNDKLEPENSIFYNYTLEYVKRNLKVSTGFIYNRINNMIYEDFNIIDSQGYYNFIQFGSIQSRSFDLNIDSQFSDIKLEISYNYNDLYDLEEYEYINSVSRHSLNSKISKNFQTLDFDVNLFYRYLGEKEIGTRTPDFEYIKLSIPGYGLWRLSISKVDLWDIIDISTGVDNIFNYINKQDLSNINPGRTFFINFQIRKK